LPQNEFSVYSSKISVYEFVVFFEIFYEKHGVYLSVVRVQAIT